MTSFLTQTGQNAPAHYLKKKAKLLVFFCLIFMVQANAQTWTKLSPPNPPFPGNILGIHFVTDQMGYVCGDNGAISKTVDCGKTWVSQNSKTTSRLYSIFFTSALNGVAVGDGGAIRITTTGGSTWSPPISVPSNSVGTDFRVVWFDAAGNGYIGGGISQVYSRILKTTDGGATWIDKSPAQTFGPGITGRAIYGIFFTDAVNGYATDFDGRILKTVDGGSNWSANSATLASNNLGGIYFTSPLVGFAVGGNPTATTGVILKTENAGTSWTTTPLPAGSFLSDIKFNSSGGAYAVGGNPSTNVGVIYKPLNIAAGNNSWVLEAAVPSSFSRLFRLSLPSSNTGYTCGLAGTVLKTPFVDATFTVANLSNGCFNVQFNNAGSSGLTYSWTFDDLSSGTNNTSTQQNPIHQFSKCGTFNVCLTVTGGGCSSTTCQTITIVDNSPPVIVCPPTYTATCSSNTAPAMAGTATATDNCTPSADISITYTDQFSGLVDCDQTIRRTWTAKDKCGNTSTCVQLIYVRDNIPPSITNCPQNQTVGTDPGQCFFTIPTPWNIIATDNCDPSPSVTLTYTDPAGVVKPFTASTTLPKGINQFVYVAKDKCGNMSKQCAFTITVKDTEAPKIICPPSISVIGSLAPTSAQCKAIASGLAPTVTDNCPMVTVTYAITGATTGSGITDVSGTSFMQGISTVIYTATDMGGNTDTCSFTVTVFCDTTQCACSPNTKPQQNMVSNGNFSFGNLGFTSDLLFSSSCGAGNYGVGANFNGFCNGWGPLFDNTQQNSTGSFLIIDGSNQSAVNVWEGSTAAFAANNTYCFSFYWALAFTHPLQNFTLDINIIGNNGNVVYVVESSIPINTNTNWVQHSKVFTLPSNFPSGTYSIAIRQTSAGAYRDFGIDDICLQEIEKPKDSCVCNPDAVVTLTKGGQTYTIGCSRRPFVPSIPCSTDSAIISTNFGCIAPDGSFCQSPSMVSWELQGPSGVIQNGNLSSSLLLKFPHNLVKTAGAYALVLKTVCPNSSDTCICISRWVQEECDTCCQSMELFSQAITNAVSITTDHKLCKATFSIGNLPPCYYIERINWGDGMQSSGTFGTGAMPMHNYANSNTYIVTYLAIARNSVTGLICFEKFFSDTIKINCCELCRRNLVKNAGFFQGAAAGDLGLGSGASSDWVAGSLTPQVAQSDSCCDAYSIQMWGSQDQGESICQVNMNFLQGKTYRIKFCGRFYNDPALTTNYVRFAFTAMNSCLSPFSCGVGSCENIGASGSITNTNWDEYQLVDWTPSQNWSTLNIRAFNNNNFPNISFGRIDNICIVEVDSIRTNTRDLLDNLLPIHIFPNPNPGNFTVELPQPATKGMTLRVTDLAGRLVLEKSTETGNVLQTMQAANLSGGMYFLQVIEKGRIVGVEKFVKQ